MFEGVTERPCAHCGRMLTQAEATLDHIVPRAFGGSNKLRNIAVACRACNTERGSSDFWDFRAYKRGRYE